MDKVIQQIKYSRFNRLTHKLTNMGKFTPHHILSWLFPVGCLSLILLGAAFINPPYHDDVSALSNGGAATFAMTSLPSLKISLPSSVSLAIEPTAEGRFGRTLLNIDVNTNSTAGYTLMMTADNDTLTRNPRINSKDYNIDALTDNYSCSGGGDDTVCADFPIGKWGYKIGDTTSTYQPITPAISAAQQINKTEEAAASSRTTLYFGSSIDTSTPTGSYQGVELTFTATTNLVLWTITYHAGNDQVRYDDVSGLPAAPQSGQFEADETEMDVTLMSAPSRAGYTFIGWCTVKPVTDDNDIDICNGGTKYDAGEQISLSISGPNNLNLYAMWSTIKATVTFTLSEGIESVDIYGYFDGGSATRTLKTNGSLRLMANEVYTITPHYATGYRAPDDNPIIKTSGDGTLTGDNYTAGTEAAEITVNAAPKTNLNLEVIFNSAQVKEVAIRLGSVNGEQVATITTSGGSTGNKLTYGANYYLIPTYQEGYTLADWNEVPDTIGELHKFNNTCGDVTAYYTIGDGKNAVELVAQEGATITNNAAMQSLEGKKPLLSSSLQTGVVYILRDSRDQREYSVAKLADCNIWMLDNLGLGSNYEDMTLTSDDTNMTAGAWTLPKTNIGGFTDRDNDGNVSDFAIGYIAPAIIATYKNSSSTNGNYQGQVGVYYNYCAATVGTYCYPSGDGIGNASPDNDICPKGWRMPTGGWSGEYDRLYVAYGEDDDDFIAALRTPLSCIISHGTQQELGKRSDFWSSTYKSDTDWAYLLRINGSEVGTKNSSARNYGSSVRCILK